MPILGIIDSQKSGHLVTSNFFSIATVTASGSSNTITFSSIPSTYSSLHLRVFGTYGYTQGWYINFNGDTGSNYSAHRLYESGGTVSAQGYASQTFAYFQKSVSGNSTYWTATTLDIIDYANTNKYKTFKAFGGYDDNGASGAANTFLNSGLWQSTSAINSITITNPNTANFTAGSSFALYGIS